MSQSIQYSHENSQRRLSQILQLFVAILFAGSLIGCSSKVPITITNQSTHVLDQVKVYGRGFSQEVGSIPSGKTVKTHVRPGGESGLGISFHANSQDINLPEEGYLENSRYTATIVINPDLSVSRDVKIRSLGEY